MCRGLSGVRSLHGMVTTQINTENLEMKRKKEWLTIPEALMYLLSLGAATNKLRLKAWVKKGRVSKSGRQVYLHARGAGGDPSYLMFRPDWIDKFLEEVNS